MSTIVLVAGSFHGAWIWERVLPRLATGDHDIHALTLTGFGDRTHLASQHTTLTTHSEDIVAAIEYADLRDVVLVAHSYGGAPATVAAARIPTRIARIVYVAGVLPVPGKSLFESSDPYAARAVQQAVDTEGGGIHIPVMDDCTLDAVFGEHGMSPEDRTFFRARASAQPVNTYRDPAPQDLSTIDTLPRTYIVCSRDPGEPPVAPGSPGYDVDLIDSGHWPMITEPVELAERIDKYARA